MGKSSNSLLMVNLGEKLGQELGGTALTKNQSQQEQSRTELVLFSAPRFYLGQFYPLLDCSPDFLVCSTGRGTTGSSGTPASCYSS